MKNIILLILVLFQYTLRGQNGLDQEYKDLAINVLDFMYDEDFSSAYSLLNKKLQDEPSNPKYLFLIGTVNFWQINLLYGLEGAEFLENKKDSVFNSFNKTMDKLIEIAESIEKQGTKVDAEMKFILGSSYGLKGLFDLQYGGIFSAISNGETGVKYLQETLKMDSSIIDCYFGLGLYNYNADNTSFFVRLLLPIFFESADKDLGLKFLEKTKKSGLLSKYHSAFILSQIYYDEGKIKKSTSYLKELNEKYIRSCTFTTLLVQRYFKLENYKESLEVFNKFERSTDIDAIQNKTLLGVLYITAAKAYEKLKDYKNAVECMKKYKKNIYPKHYLNKALEFIDYYEKQTIKN